MACHQCAVERACRGGEIIRCCRGGQGGDCGINSGAFNAGIIATTQCIGRRATPIIGLLIARRQRGVIAVNNHVEIKVLQTPLILAGVHQPHRQVNADLGQHAAIGQRKAFVFAALHQKLQTDLCAVGGTQCFAVKPIAGGVQYGEGLALQLAVAARPVAEGRAVAGFQCLR